MQIDFDIAGDYPSRKTFSNYFGSFNEALKRAGFKSRPEYSKKYLLDQILRFIEEFGRQPKSRDFEKLEGYPHRKTYDKYFGSWNNALIQLGLPINVSKYTDKELENYFKNFVEKYGRVPTIPEFNDNPNYPSFWCYQNRFGSWNKAVEAYGYEVNGGASGTYYVFENGEVCASSYEFDVSNWLRKHKISYLRNIPYKDFLSDYYGKKNCDYGIIHNGEWIFLEIAGLYTTRDKKSSMEKDYINRFNDKIENLLVHFNSKVFYPEDFKSKTLDELFSFLWEIESRPWFENEPLYQGTPEEVI